MLPKHIELIIDYADTCPVTTPEQDSLGIGALKALFLRDRRASASLLGSALWKILAGNKDISLNDNQAAASDN